MPRKPTTAKAKPGLKTTAEKAAKRLLDAFPDRIDLRDWYYQPALISVPDEASCDKSRLKLR